MGLIKAAFGAAGGIMAEQWKEYFYCEAIPADVLAVKGKKRRLRVVPATQRGMITSLPTALSSPWQTANVCSL